MPREITLGQIDQFYHALVGFTRGRSEREHAVPEQHHAGDVFSGSPGKQLGAPPRQAEAGHDVGDDDDLVAVNFRDALLTVAGVGDCQHSIGMRVIDVFVRQQRVQYSLYRRCGRCRARHVGDEFVHYLRIAQRLELRELEQMCHAHRREARFLDEFEVLAAALDVEDVLVVADEVALPDFDRRIAAAVQHQRFVASEQARAIDALREIALEPRGFLVVPQTLHLSVFGNSSFARSLSDLGPTGS